MDDIDDTVVPKVYVLVDEDGRGVERVMWDGASEWSPPPGLRAVPSDEHHVEIVATGAPGVERSRRRDAVSNARAVAAEVADAGVPHHSLTPVQVAKLAKAVVALADEVISRG